MRRLQLLVQEVRRQTENLDTSGIDDRDIIQYFNEAQDRLQSRITSKYPMVFLKEDNITTVVGQEAYALPTDMYLGTRIVSVDWKFGSGANDYWKIRKADFNERFTHVDGLTPTHYIRRDDEILINPLQTTATTDGLRITYQQKLRDLDVRRGEVSTAAKTGDVLDTITVDLTPTLAKDVDTDNAGAVVLGDIDYVCVVDRDGVIVLEKIPIDGYVASTGVLTMTAAFSTTVTVATLTGNFLVGGHTATTHSDLKDVCERFLIQYTVYKILRRDANDIEAEMQFREVKELEADIVKAYASPDEDILDLPLDVDWNQL